MSEAIELLRNGLKSAAVIARAVGEQEPTGDSLIETVVQDYDSLHTTMLAIREQREQYRNERDALAAKLADCEADRLEQARCNGMGSEREARLMARLAETEALLLEALPAVHSYARKHCRAVVAAARRNDVANVAKHADIEKRAWGLADKIRAFLALDSAP